MPANEICGLRLDFLPCLRVGGADAETFLQGQLSNDVHRLTPDLGQLSSYSNPKGRLLAVMHLRRNGDGIEVELHRSVHESVLKRLRMFVLRSKVTLTLSETQSLGVMGPGSTAFLRDAGLPCPDAPLACTSHNHLTVMRRIGAQPRYSLHGPESALAEIENKLPAATENDWTLADIEDGVPTIYAETQDRFVPQWCNLDSLGGISFDKGCYTGQEIVARMHYLGSVKRRMVRASAQAPPPVPGTLLFDPAQGEQSTGEVVQAAVSGSGCVLSLVRQVAYTSSSLRIGSPDGLPLQGLEHL